jgi:beta-galactosidase
MMRTASLQQICFKMAGVGCIGILLWIASAASAADGPSPREVISLDGTWQVEEARGQAEPKEFTHEVVVPGLVDMARPAFVEPGPTVKERAARPQKDPRRDAFWYRRTFRIDRPLPEVATLKIAKAMFGTRVVLNGKLIGDHLPCFTPGLFDVRSALKQGENELLVRVGADRDAVWGRAQSGYDSEKVRYVPGIYDSVELILSGSPHIVNVQAVPEIEKKLVTVHAWLRHTGAPAATKLHVTVREASTGRVAGEGDCAVTAGGDGERTVQVTIPIADCRLWSPEDPFLYDLEVRGETDAFKTRFGMREFHLDPASGRAILNGRPYYMRGTSTTVYRLFEDSECGDKPWREEWVRRLHRRFKEMHWNSLRYCIGFPPESWYRIADEEGLLIQDEFPIWYCMPKPGDLDGDELAVEYKEWMQARWNHPCVVLWDACNETYSPETGKAIRKVRGLDLSKRPWDNGWAEPVDPGDSDECHPYHFIFGPDQPFRLPMLARDPGTKAGLLIAQPCAAEKLLRKNPLVINEYGGLWLNRDGTPTTLTKPVYEYLLGSKNTTAERRHLYARLLAAITEFFRSHRQAAAVQYYGAVDYSRPDGQTSDDWVDVEKLTFEPEFYRYVRDAFAPVGLMIDAWADTYPPGPGREFPVAVINDLYENWKGTVRFRLLRDGAVIAEKSQPCEVAPLGRLQLKFAIDIPAEQGAYQVEAALVQPGVEPVRSLRDFRVVADQKGEGRR